MNGEVTLTDFGFCAKLQIPKSVSATNEPFIQSKIFSDLMSWCITWPLERKSRLVGLHGKQLQFGLHRYMFLLQRLLSNHLELKI